MNRLILFYVKCLKLFVMCVSKGSFKCKSAFKLEIPVVHSEYIFRYLNNEIVNYKDYLIVNNENCEYFKRGKILKSNFYNIYKRDVILKINHRTQIKIIKNK